MIDEIVAIPRKKRGRVIGRLNESERIALDQCSRSWSVSPIDDFGPRS